MYKIIDQWVSGCIELQGKIIKEMVETGFRYLVIKKGFFSYEDNKIKYNYSYHRYNSIAEVEMFKKDGYEIFDLYNVIEYLKEGKKMFNKKTTYENIYDWAESGEGTCFYCKKKKPVFIELVGKKGKGICRECAENFRIGHFQTDYNAIMMLSPEFKSHAEALKWLTEKGAELVFIDYDNVTLNYQYHAINNREVYDRYRKQGKLIDYHVGSSVNKDLLFSYNKVEINEDGNIQIECYEI